MVEGVAVLETAPGAVTRFVTIDAMDEAQLTAELRALDQDASLVLAVFAVVGRASLSVAELAELAGLPDARPAVAELERRGLVVREDGDRYAVARAVQSRLKRLLASADDVDRVLRGFIQIAEDGRLTIDDLDAVAELTRVAAETGRWAELLQLAEAAESTLSTTRRVEAWVEIVERRLEAARVLGDTRAASRAEAELDRIARTAGATTVAYTEAEETSPSGGPSTALALLGAAVVGAVGIGVGYAIGDQTSEESDATTLTETVSSTETVTITEEGGTATETETVTETGATVTETETVTETVTETETVVG